MKQSESSITLCLELGLPYLFGCVDPHPQLQEWNKVRARGLLPLSAVVCYPTAKRLALVVAARRGPCPLQHTCGDAAAAARCFVVWGFHSASPCKRWASSHARLTSLPRPCHSCRARAASSACSTSLWSSRSAAVSGLALEGAVELPCAFVDKAHAPAADAQPRCSQRMLQRCKLSRIACALTTLAPCRPPVPVPVSRGELSRPSARSMSCRVQSMQSVASLPALFPSIHPTALSAGRAACGAPPA